MTELYGRDVKDFGAKGDGIANDTPAIQAAIDSTAAAGGGVVRFPPGTYILNGTVDVKSNITLSLYGAKIKIPNGINNNAFRIVTSAINVTIMGGELDGNKANNPTSGSGIISQGNSQMSYIMIRDVYIHDFREHGIQLIGLSTANPIRYLTIQGCTIQACSGFGIAGGSIEEFSWINNIIINTSLQSLVGTGGPLRYGVISGNTISGGATSQYQATSNLNTNLTVTNNISRNAASHGISIGGRNITVSGNEVNNFVNAGIYISSGAGNETTNASVCNNIVDTNTGGWAGIAIYKTNGFTVTGNSVMGCFHGIQISTSSYRGVISNNTCHANLHNGLSINDSWSVAITGNTCAGNIDHGIELSNSNGCSIKSNACRLNATPIRESGTADNNHYAANECLGNTSDLVTILGANSIWHDSGRVAGTNSIPSSATVFLYKYTDWFIITGTTNVTALGATWAKRFVTLRFDNVLTFTDGNNLKLKGDFVTAAGSTISLVYDGTDYWEISRSTN